MSIWTSMGLSMALLSSSASPLVAADWYVDVANCPGGSGTESDPFCSIAQAVAVARDGDQVLITPGRYAESLTIDQDLVLRRQGSGQVLISGSFAARPLETLPGSTIVLRGLHLCEGRAGAGGAILNKGDLSLLYCTVEDSVAERIGGGILNLENLWMFGCEVRRNRAENKTDTFGGGIFNAGIMTLRHCTLWENCSVASNFLDLNAEAYGGGIANYGEAELLNCTLSANEARVDLDTKSRPSGLSSGGAVHNEGSIHFDHCTIAFNLAIANARGTAEAYGGGVRNARPHVAGFDSTVVSDNEVIGIGSMGGGYFVAEEGPDCWGSLHSAGWNMVRDCSDFTFTGTTRGNRCGVNPLLLPLASNGGPVLTHALRSGSPAADSGRPSAPLNPPWDARGYPRALADEATRTSDRGAWEGGGAASFRLQSFPVSVVPLNSTLYLTTSRGPRLESSWTYVVSVNGAPSFIPLLRRTLGPSGGWTLETTVPGQPALSGLSLGLQAFSLNSQDLLVSSNVHTIRLL